MKKVSIITIVIILTALVSYQGHSECVSKKDSETRTATAYYCDPGMGYCLRFQGNGDIWLTLPGILKTITIQVPIPKLVPTPDQGYNELCKFFLFTENPSTTSGLGLIDGCLHYKDPSSTFYYYELETQTVINDYSIWQQQVNY